VCPEVPCRGIPGNPKDSLPPLVEHGTKREGGRLLRSDRGWYVPPPGCKGRGRSLAHGKFLPMNTNIQTSEATTGTIQASGEVNTPEAKPKRKRVVKAPKQTDKAPNVDQPMVLFQPSEIQFGKGLKTLTPGQKTGKLSKKLKNADGTARELLSSGYSAQVPGIAELEKQPDNAGLSKEALAQKRVELGQQLRTDAAPAIGCMQSSKHFILRSFRAGIDRETRQVKSASAAWERVAVTDKAWDLHVTSGKPLAECYKFLGIEPPVNTVEVKATSMPA